MKFLMGMAQAVFGLIWIGFVALVSIIGIGIIIVQDTINWFREVNKEIKENIKEYYRNIEKNERNEENESGKT